MAVIKRAALYHIVVHSGKPDCVPSEIANLANQILVYFAGKHHLHNTYGAFVRNTQPILEFAFNVHCLKRFVNFRAASVHKHNSYADC